MARFLSEEWGKAVERAMNADDSFKSATKGIDLTIQQVVTNVPDRGEVKYWLQFKDGQMTWNTGEAPQADATLTQSYETARDLNLGALNPQVAFMQGKLKIAGNIGKLLQHQAAVSTMVPVLASIPTEF